MKVEGCVLNVYNLQFYNSDGLALGFRAVWS